MMTHALLEIPRSWRIIAIANPQHERGSTGYPFLSKGKAHDDSFNVAACGPRHLRALTDLLLLCLVRP
ncbi:hypothetical protein JTE90_029156 [Oedothorax gibbosus]|uniref:Uncharacterized protein n=1 Tax=Oedothorax gibbosus TaxID=931172 RepID=A0AAV6TH19_9ARAC|nr:hypothetical protein JTE90_029156 [Oedothorax gibbosus]